MPKVLLIIKGQTPFKNTFSHKISSLKKARSTVVAFNLLPEIYFWKDQALQLLNLMLECSCSYLHSDAGQESKEQRSNSSEYRPIMCHCHTFQVKRNPRNKIATADLLLKMLPGSFRIQCFPNHWLHILAPVTPRMDATRAVRVKSFSEGEVGCGSLHMCLRIVGLLKGTFWTTFTECT